MRQDELTSSHVFDRVVDLLISKAHVTQTITLDTEILKDLCLWGDDVDNFFKSYVQEFQLDMSNLRFTDYFPREGDHFWLSLKAILKGKESHKFYRPIKISDLVDFALTKQWKLKPLEP